MNCRLLRAAGRRLLPLTAAPTVTSLPVCRPHMHLTSLCVRTPFWRGWQCRPCHTDPKDGKETPADPTPELSLDEELKQLSLLQRYKKLGKEYWYVLIPVHCCTSIFWFGSCLAVVFTGIEVDLVYIAECLHLPEGLVKPLRNPNLGKLAVALMLYKLVSPLRYMSTVYAAIPSIKYLVRRRLIKPVPRLTSKAKIGEEISRIKRKITKKRGED